MSKSIHYHFAACTSRNNETATTARKDVTCQKCLSLMGPDPEKLEGYHFPATKFSVEPCTIADFIAKAREELDEVEAESEGPNVKALVMECMDVIQVMESAVRKLCRLNRIDMQAVRRAVFEKNRVRGYYEQR